MAAQLEIFAAGHPAREALAQRLLATGALTQAGLDRASRLASESGERLERVLAQLGLVSELDIADARSLVLRFTNPGGAPCP